MSSALVRRVARAEMAARRQSPLMVEIWRLSDAELQAGIAENRARIASHEARDAAERLLAVGMPPKPTTHSAPREAMPAWRPDSAPRML